MTNLTNNFYDRKSIIELLKRRVIDLKEGYRQNIAFLGNRFIGKTAILQKFMADLDDEAIVEIYIDLDHKDLDYFVHKFIGSLLYQFARLKNLTPQNDINLLLETTKKYLPQTNDAVRKIRANLLKGKNTEAYRDLISLPEIFCLESGKFCVVMLDEFHNLEEFGLPNVFQELGKKIMTQQKCIYIVTSSLGDIAQQILSEKLSLLFGHFEVISVDAFNLETAQGFIQENLKDINIGNVLKNFLVDFTGGHPFYLSVICRELKNLSALHNQKDVYLPLVIQALENTIFYRWGILSRHFEILLYQLSYAKGQAMIPRLLISLVNGKNKLNDITQDLTSKKTSVAQKLNRLIDLGIVNKNGNVYHLQDKLLKYWIKYVYQKQMDALKDYDSQASELFCKEIEQLVNTFQIISQKDLSSRIIELFHCFGDEAFEIKGRKYKLPSFREVVPFKLTNVFPHDFDVVRAESAEGVWFIILKRDALHEGEISAFLAESKKLNAKPQRQIIISLNELDANARLRALQEKAWIWNEGEINTLLSLYDKPYIVK